MNREVLEAEERILGPEHSDTLISKGNLANCLKDCGKLEDPGGKLIASLGCSAGKNIERNLHARLRKLQGCSLEPFWITLSLKDLQLGE